MITSTTVMSYSLLNVETFCLRLPTLKGIEALLHNTLIISDRLAINYRGRFVACGIVLWTYPSVFTWLVWPFKKSFVYILYLLGFEKGTIRKGSYATSYQREYYGGYIPEYSTFSNLQSMATMGEMEDEEPAVVVPFYARALGWMAGMLTVRGMWSSSEQL